MTGKTKRFLSLLHTTAAYVAGVYAVFYVAVGLTILAALPFACAYAIYWFVSDIMRMQAQ